MMSRVDPTPARHVRKLPTERRAEILDEAARIALTEGLERVTLRGVAEQLGVRPGLIGHYFPAVQDLVISAFELAIEGEREAMFAGDGSPLDRIAHLVHRIESRRADDLARLWLNARHLSRFSTPLLASIEEQEALDRARLTELIARGVAEGEFATPDVEASCIRIFMAIDAFGCYVNDRGPFSGEAFSRFVGDVTVWTLSLDRSAFEAAMARQA